MVVRRRLRAILFPLALYCLSGAAGSYFLWHAVNDERGLHANANYELQIKSLQTQVDEKEKERRAWERRIALLSGRAIDRDMLDEEARARLGRVDKDDLIVFLKPNADAPPASATP
ncbi:septation inhibitor protein [Methylovirgula ligni]|uniref:FtsB family cell division protein n=1 Tax=Methylovirgula ligni TaxID=569860 RepID=UPI000E26BB00|nr:septum formation initiator family protein [Methylovirgula ligni]QAY96773.1 septation inhibitor protein [Methylovirgula ligni]